MTESVIIAASALAGIVVVALALLSAWRGWLELQRRQLDLRAPEIEGGAGIGTARIEISDLKERIRKLEAIASGVDL